MAAPEKKGLSLYSHLLPTSSTISGAPVKYGSEGSPPGDGNQQAKKPKDAALQFQPMRRPTGMQKPGKVKPSIPPSSSSSIVGHQMSSSAATAASDHVVLGSSSPEKQVALASSNVPQLGQKRANFEDWVAGDDEDEYYFERNKSSRKSKKKKNQMAQTRTWGWNDIYDPTMPTSYADYKKSDERYDMISEWKAHLRKAHAKVHRQKSHSQQQSALGAGGRPLQFAPPSNLNFAPPASYGDETSQLQHDDTGEDAYARRMRMAAATANQVQASVPSPPKPVVASSVSEDRAAMIARQVAEMKARVEAQRLSDLSNTQPVSSASPPSMAGAAPPPPSPPLPPPPPVIDEPRPPPPATEPTGTLSRAPVRYEVADTQPDAVMEVHSAQAGEVQSNYSKKEGFAKRYMERLGWDGKTGLGAREQGIMTAIKVLPEKRKKRSDAEGGGFVISANMGKIVGGKKAKTSHEEDDTADKVSVVVKLSGMLDGMDVEQEIQDNNLLQEIGDDMGENYGTIERLFVWREENGGNNEVFVKFTNQASAVRAVNGMEGTTFGGNNITASYWDPDKFDSGEYA